MSALGLAQLVKCWIYVCILFSSAVYMLAGMDLGRQVHNADTPEASLEYGTFLKLSHCGETSGWLAVWLKTYFTE